MAGIHNVVHCIVRVTDRVMRAYRGERKFCTTVNQILSDNSSFSGVVVARAGSSVKEGPYSRALYFTHNLEQYFE